MPDHESPNHLCPHAHIGKEGEYPHAVCRKTGVVLAELPEEGIQRAAACPYGIATTDGCLVLIESSDLLPPYRRERVLYPDDWVE